MLFTLKARRELAEIEPGLDEEDAREALMRLRAEDCFGRLRSEATGEWMLVFKPSLAGARIYVKVIVRSACVVISFHEDEGFDDDESA